MKTPTNGGTSPSTVAIATSHGSSIRRRASLYTQYPIASQKTTSRKIARFRTIGHVPDPKKSFSAPKKPSAATTIAFSPTGGAVPRHSLRQTRARRSPGRRPWRTRRRSACRRHSSSYVVFLSSVQVREEIERAGHEDARAEVARARECDVRVSERLDVCEVPSCPLGELGRGQRAFVHRLGRNQAVSRPRQALEHAVDVLVGEHGGADDVAGLGYELEQALDGRGGVRAVPDLRAALLVAAGER